MRLISSWSIEEGKKKLEAKLAEIKMKMDKETKIC